MRVVCTRVDLLSRDSPPLGRTQWTCGATGSHECCNPRWCLAKDGFLGGSTSERVKRNDFSILLVVKMPHTITVLSLIAILLIL
mmetsp:Transcript_7521/g.15603  ORF Transcript_7521/g.15603 Transcript_7521/m.15603 type:complete len:84 (-) Transcript_7521:554-805(-)